MALRPPCSCCVGYEDVFSARLARRELRRYKRKGPRRTTRVLVEAVSHGGVTGESLLDVGGGVGVIQHELKARGASGVTDVDASPNYLEAAKGEAQARGYSGHYILGDFAQLGHTLQSADIVTLDRVVCCYKDMRGLIGAATARARRRIGLVMPRDTWWARFWIRAGNAWLRLTRNPFRLYAHRPQDVHAQIRATGFRRTYQERTALWQVDVYERVPIP